MLIFQGRLLSIWKVGITIFLLLPVLQSYSVKVRKCFQHYKYQLLTIKYIFFKVVITYENVILIICMVRIKACSIFDFQRQMFFYIDLFNQICPFVLPLPSLRKLHNSILIEFGIFLDVVIAAFQRIEVSPFKRILKGSKIKRKSKC